LGHGQTCEDEAVTKLDVANNEGGKEGKEEVPQPIGSRRESALLRTRARRERLADENPDARGPSHRIAQDEEAGRDNHDCSALARSSLHVELELTLAYALVRRRVLCSACGCEDKQPHGLPHASDDQRVTTPELRNDI
jgi:hypothetical protein